MSGTCGATGGRRHKNKRTMKGGMGYGFGGTIGTAGPVWDSSWGGEVTKAGTPIYDTADRPAVTGGRRTSKKGSRKSKKQVKRKQVKKTRKMRGGAQWQSAAAVGYGYTGTGARGLADATAYASKVPPSGAPSQNADGAYSA